MKHASYLALLLVFAGCQIPGRMARLSQSGTAPDPVAAYEKAYPGQDGVYTSYDWTLEHDLKVDFTSNVPHWQFYEVVNRAYMVLDPEGEGVGRFELTVGPRQELDGVRLRLRTVDGTTRRFDAGDLKKERLPDGRLRYVMEYSPVARGTFIEEGYEVRYSDLVKHPVLEHDVPLRFAWPSEKVRFRYIYPQEWAVRLKHLDSGKALPLQTTRDRKRETVILTYEKNNVAAFHAEPFGPTFKEAAPYFNAMVTELSVANELLYASPKDWPAQAEAYEPYVIKPNDPLSARLRKRATEVSKAHSQSLDRLHAVLGYAQHRYRVKARELPGGYGDVVKEQAGGPLQIAGITQALLRGAGFDVQFLMVHSADAGYFDPAFVSPSQWSIPALEIRGAGAANYYVFPTLTDVPFGFVPDAYVGQTAMIVTEAGFGGFTELSPGPIALNTDEERYVVHVGDNKDLKVEEEKILRGATAYEVRRRLGRTPEAAWDSVMEDLITFDAFSLTGYEVSNRTANDKALLVKLTYTVDRRVSNRGGDLSVDLAGVLAPVSRHDSRVSMSGRTQPLRVRQEQRVKKQVLLNHPDNWVVITPLADRTNSNAYGILEKAYSVGAGQVGVYQQLWLKPASVPRSAIPDFEAVASHGGAREPISFTDAPIVAGTPLPPDPGGPWTLVLASEADEAHALDLASRFARDFSDYGYRVDVLGSTSEGLARYRVVIGMFETRTELETTLNSLQGNLPYDTWMLELPIAPATNTAGTPEQEHPE